MAKTFRKVAGKATGKSLGRGSGKKIPRGKNIGAYNVKRRFSLADSSSNSSSDSDSESSLTEVSDGEDEEASRRGSVFFPPTEQYEHDSNSSSEESESSSDDDSDVDLVKLQAERKARSMKSMKGKKPSKNTVKRKNGVSKPKFGRRKSENALPEDIDFTFDFEKLNDNAIEDLEDEEKVPTFQDAEEDFGEEVENMETSNAKPTKFDFDMVQVPKIKDDEINSDEDYEIDDNELLATLQAENDLDELVGLEPPKSRDRNNSIGSLNDDDENDPFLREEEKFLVNEFENNGFDDEVLGVYESTEVKPEETTTFEPAKNYEDEDEDEEDEDEDYVNMMDFSATFLDDKSFTSPQKKKNSPTSDDEDDSYLWNYFFSSDNESNGEDSDGYENDLIQAGFEQHDNVEEDDEATDAAFRSYYENMESDDGYDSGDSTDVDLNLPASSNKSKFGSKQAKEVLSSKTADYRPPVLGTWAAVDSKPFGIIDGLSTRTLNNISNRNVESRQKNRKSVVHTNTDDLALGIDELLNISELDNDDENDIRIWRDFNNQKKRVPLGAFRNKGHLHDSMPINYHHKPNHDFNQRRYSLTSGRRNSFNKNRKQKKNGESAKMRRKRASIVEAVAEGYRPTKSGVFSEHALADVEEVLGDDNDLMALIKGL